MQRLALALAVLVPSLVACGGGASVGPSVPTQPPSTATVTVGFGGGSPVPSSSPKASASPGAGASPPAGGSASASATPIAGATTPAIGAAPGASPSPASTGPVSAMPAPTAPADAAGHVNVVPAALAPGACRAGQTYSIYVAQAATGDTVAFTVFEPSTLCGGQTYPLILQGAGFGGSRTTSISGNGAPSDSGGSATGGNGLGNDIAELVTNGYGVISFDQRGMGETTGKIRVMDPDFEGKDYLAVMDWAQAKLGWITYGPTLEGDDPHEPMMGSIGGSYGGMYQMMLLNIDKRHRLHAITPNITPSDLSFSLFQNTTPKTEWNYALFGAGTVGTNTAAGLNRGNFDPFVTNVFATDGTAGVEDPYAVDFFGYHSADYFDDGRAFATNGGAGTMPQLPPGTSSPKVNAMLWIGVRDTLFNFNNGYANYANLSRGGGDVRLLSYQAGHNSLKVVPDPYVVEYYGANDDADSRCGSRLNEDAAQLAWFDQYLKGRSGAANVIPTQPCVSLSIGDAVLVPQVIVGENGTPFDVGSTNVVAGTGTDVAIASQTLFVAGPGGALDVGIPHVRLTVTPTAASAGTPTIYVGLGQVHASSPATYDLVDNQVSPLRGTGTFDLDIIGGGTRLAAGDKLVLLYFGSHDQYAPTGNVNTSAPGAEPVTVTGTAWLPIVSNASPF